MIDLYLEATRRMRATTPLLCEGYAKTFEALASELGVARPELFVVNSSICKAQLITIMGRDYLIYDQQLGQSFNQLNRIMFANRPELLLRAFVFKRLAHLLVTKNAMQLASLMALAYAISNNESRDKGSSHAADPRMEVRRLNYTSVQEIAVIAHEIAHFAYRANATTLKPVATEAIKDYLQHTIDAPVSRDAVRKRYGASVAKTIVKDRAAQADRWRRVLDSLDDRLIEETGCDEIGTVHAFQLSVRLLGTPPEDACAAIILAFKHLRLLGHLEAVAEQMAREENAGLRIKDLAQRLGNAFWGGFERLTETQLREHFIFSQLQRICHYFDYDVSACLARMQDERDRFDKVIEDVVWKDVIYSIAEMMVRIGSEVPSVALGTIDEMLGWNDVLNPPPTAEDLQR